MKYVFILCLALGATRIHAQTAADSVKATINKMFESMKSGDSVSLASVFADGSILQTIVSKEGSTAVRTEDISKFISSISSLPKGAADERITFETVKTDGALAIAWTPYKFYFKGQYSHCGVNSFQLVRLNGQWKIQYIIDTRRKDCSN